MDKKAQFVLDFLVNFNYDKGEVEKLKSNLKGLTDSALDLNLDISNDDVLYKISTELDKVLSVTGAVANNFDNMMANISPDEIKKFDNAVISIGENLDKIDPTIFNELDNKIANIDFGKLDTELIGVAQSLQEIENIDTKIDIDIEALANVNDSVKKLKTTLDDVPEAAKPLSDSFDKLYSNAEKAVQEQTKALLDLAVAGKKGSAEYNNVEQALASAVKEVQKFDQIAKDIETDISIKIDVPEDLPKIDIPVNFDAAQIKAEFNSLGSAFDEVSNSAKSSIDTQKKALATLKLQGKEGTEEYNQLKQSIVNVSKEAKRLDQIAKDIDTEIDFDINPPSEEKVGKFKSSMQSLSAGGGVLGGLSDTIMSLTTPAGAATAAIGLLTAGFVSAWNEGNKFNDAIVDLSAKTGAVGDELKELEEGAKDLFRKGVGEGVADAVKIIGEAKIRLGDVFNTQELVDFTAKANALGKAYDLDVNEVIKKSAPFIKQFGLQSGEAFDLIAFAQKNGATAQDDILDSLAEYSQLASKAGYSAQQFLGILTAGGKDATFNTDKLADAIKETEIRIKAGDFSTAFKGINDSATEAEKALIKPIEAIVQAGQRGELTIQETLQKSTKLIDEAFKGGDISESLASQLQVAIAGTPAEDIGTQLFSKIFSSDIDTTEITKQATKVGKDISKAVGSNTTFQSVSKELSIFTASVGKGLVNIGQGILDFLTKVVVNSPIVKISKEVFNGIMRGLEPLQNAFNKVVASISSLFSGAGEGIDILETLGSVFTFIGKIIGTQVQFAVTLMTATLTGLLEVVNLGVQGIDFLIESLVAFAEKTGFIDFINNLIDRFTQFYTNTTQGFQIFISGASALASNIPALFEVIFEAANAYLNPANWFSDKGDEARKNVQDKLGNIFDGIKSTVDGKISEIKLGEAITKSLNVKEEGLKVQAFDELLLEYQNTTDVIKKNELAQEIQKIAPGVVSGMEKAVDSTGKIQDVMKINIDKAKEFGEAQRDAFNFKNDTSLENVKRNLEEQAALYDKNKTKVTELQTAIIEGSKKGIDTSALEEEYEKAFDKLKADGEAIGEGLAKLETGEIAITGVNLPDSFEKDFQDKLSKVVVSADTKTIQDELKNIFKLQGDIDNTEVINKLVDNFNNATNELDKESFAKRIQEQIPDAVEAIGTFTDENGKIVTQYKVNEKAVEDFVSKAKNGLDNELNKSIDNITSGLAKQGEGYVNIGNDIQKKQEELKQAIINKDKEAIARIQGEIAGLEGNAKKSKEEMIKSLADVDTKGVATDKMFDQMAKTLKKSPDEVHAMVKLQQESINKTKEQVTAAKSLGEAWDANRKAVQDAVAKNQSEILGLNKRIKEIANKDAKERTIAEQKELTEGKARANELFKETKKLAKEDIQIKKETEALNKRLYPEEISKFERAKKIFEQEKATSEFELSSFELAKERQLVDENRNKDSFDELQLAKERVKTEKEKLELFKTSFNAFIKTAGDGVIDIKPNLPAEQKKELEDQLITLNKDINDSNKNELDILAKINVDTNEVENKLDELRIDQIEWEIAVGIRDTLDFTDIFANIDKREGQLRDKVKDVQNKILNDKKVLVTTTDAIEKAQIQNRIKNYELEEVELTKTLREQSGQRVDLIQREFDFGNKKIEDAYAKRKELLEKEVADFQTEAEKSTQTFQRLMAKSSENSLDDIDSVLDSDLKKQTARLDRMLRYGEISEEQHAERVEAMTIETEARKNEAIKQAEAERILIEEAGRFQRLESERIFHQKQLELEIEATEEKQRQLEELQSKLQLQGLDLTPEQQAELDRLDSFHAELQEKHKENADVSATVIGESQKLISDAMTDLFTGNSDEAGEKMKGFFAGILGLTSQYLQKEVQAAILKMMIDWFKTADMPFYTKVLLTPVAYATSTALVQGIAKPILSQIASFSTGGRVDEPTVAVVGDAKNARPGSDSEWIFRDDQLKMLFASVVKSAYAMMEQRLANIENLLDNLDIVITGENLHLATSRYNYRQKSRGR